MMRSIFLDIIDFPRSPMYPFKVTVHFVPSDIFHLVLAMKMDCMLLESGAAVNARNNNRQTPEDGTLFFKNVYL